MRDLRANIINTISRAIANLSSVGRFTLGILVVIFLGAVIWILCDISAAFLVTIPERGGSLTIGSVGKPQLVNPILAQSDTDNTMVALVYSGLTRFDISQQKMIPDAAESWTVSPDGRTYTFTLKSGLTFQDGKPLTANDVIFTVNAIKNPDIHSSLAANWTGIVARALDARTVQFVLPTPYAAFLENTTVGILPAHLWQNVPASQFSLVTLNSAPIGSGPYELAHVFRDMSGTPTAYSLKPFSNFALEKPYIGIFNIRFYEDATAAQTAAVNQQISELGGISADEAALLAKNDFQIDQFPLPRVFGIFFNQSQNAALTDPIVRQALNDATDRSAITEAVFGEYATPIAGPVPPVFLSSPANDSSAVTLPNSASTTVANALLDKDGWVTDNNGIREKKGTLGTTTLSFAISTADAPELVATADQIAADWRSVGADVTVKVFQSGFKDQVIQPRNYDALLFGQDVGRDFDLYPFWASSESADPGLNIALYNNPIADALLDDLRATTTPQTRQRDYAAFASLLSRDMPAIFIYEPHFVDAHRAVAGVAQGPIANASERFSDVYRWYVQTEDVWRVFASNTAQDSY